MLPGDQGTLISNSDGTFVNHPTNPEYDGTMLQYGDGTMLNHGDGTLPSKEGEEGPMAPSTQEDGTMLKHGDGTMLNHGTGPGSAISRYGCEHITPCVKCK